MTTLGGKLSKCLRTFKSLPEQCQQQRIIALTEMKKKREEAVVTLFLKMIQIVLIRVQLLKSKTP